MTIFASLKALILPVIAPGKKLPIGAAAPQSGDGFAAMMNAMGDAAAVPVGAAVPAASPPPESSPSRMESVEDSVAPTVQPPDAAPVAPARIASTPGPQPIAALASAGPMGLQPADPTITPAPVIASPDLSPVAPPMSPQVDAPVGPPLHQPVWQPAAEANAEAEPQAEARTAVEADTPRDTPTNDALAVEAVPLSPPSGSAPPTIVPERPVSDDTPSAAQRPLDVVVPPPVAPAASPQVDATLASPLHQPVWQPAAEASPEGEPQAEARTAVEADTPRDTPTNDALAVDAVPLSPPSGSAPPTIAPERSVSDDTPSAGPLPLDVVVPPPVARASMASDAGTPVQTDGAAQPASSPPLPESAPLSVTTGTATAPAMSAPIDDRVSAAFPAPLSATPRPIAPFPATVSKAGPLPVMHDTKLDKMDRSGESAITTAPAPPVPAIREAIGHAAAPFDLPATSVSPPPQVQAIVLPRHPAIAVAPDGVLPDQPAAPASTAASLIVAEPTVQSEALSLLQLVREQFTRRKPADGSLASVPADGGGRGSDPIAPVPTLATVAPTIMTMPPALVPVPVNDISGALASQAVDMGVEGQWIDGLAREIASLSANGGQGSFQIRSDQLGPVQVAIRQGPQGADISLTVASEAAEQALRQDSDRLRADGALSAVRIADVRIERAAMADPARSDPGQQSPSQQNGSTGGGPFAGAGQGMNQGRSQAQENLNANHKASADAAVLDHVDARDGAAGGASAPGRARYA